MFFDVGANIGLFSLHASKRIGTEGRVFSFEPSPETYKRLKKNFEVNDINNAVADNVGGIIMALFSIYKVFITLFIVKKHFKSNLYFY